ncbi:hypothetical protein AVEN_51169-1 [Araneus ventricosus]|uniref:Uncharacterized protein n=1 Tax=Araneus ventricosus TaxID=182803 RepID=A0A4Y2N690_ARAVE|nr:hypothetical protein AVEN_51169-1 [Araneus ventricosus]
MRPYDLTPPKFLTTKKRSDKRIYNRPVVLQDKNPEEEKRRIDYTESLCSSMPNLLSLEIDIQWSIMSENREIGERGLETGASSSRGSGGSDWNMHKCLLPLNPGGGINLFIRI